MSEKTKSCNLTENEIKVLIKHHGFQLNVNPDKDRIDRINYLNKRLKTFNEVDAVKPSETANATPQEKVGW